MPGKWLRKQDKQQQIAEDIEQKASELIASLGDRAGEILSLHGLVQEMHSGFLAGKGRGAIVLIDDQISYQTLGRSDKYFWRSIKTAFPSSVKEVNAIMRCVKIYDPDLFFVAVWITQTEKGTWIKMGCFTQVLMSDDQQIDEHAVDFAKALKQVHIKRLQTMLSLLTENETLIGQLENAIGKV